MLYNLAKERTTPASYFSLSGKEFKLNGSILFGVSLLSFLFLLFLFNKVFILFSLSFKIFSTTGLYELYKLLMKVHISGLNSPTNLLKDSGSVTSDI